MTYHSQQLLLVALQLVLITSRIHAEVVTCYVASWANYRTGDGSFKFEDIDPYKCTHIIYAFVSIDDDGNIKMNDPYLDINLKGFERFNALKEKNGNLKTLIAVGGASASSKTFSDVFSVPSKRHNFKTSAIKFLKTHKFNGLDLDWEYPGQLGGAPYDKDNFSKLIQELIGEFNNNGFLLTAAVPAEPSSVDTSYDVSTLSRNLHFIHVMAYDFHGSWNNKTGENAPLYPSSDDKSDFEKSLNVDASIRGWLDRGADPHKLVLGLGAYGRSFTLADSNQNGIGAPVTGAGNPGPISQEDGILGYDEICKYQREGWHTEWSNEQHVPYAFNDNQWVGFDNPDSIREKVNYGKGKNLAGAMVWSIETDDPRGVCGENFPLLTTINKVYGGGMRKHRKHFGKPTKKQKEHKHLSHANHHLV